MSLIAARTMVALPTTRSSWDYIVNHPKQFLWTDDEDVAYAWNQLSGGLPQAVQDGDQEHGFFLHYRGKSLQIPIRYSRDDGLIQMHTLAAFVVPDSELRFCVESCGSSDVALLAMSSADWARLEVEFGQAAVDFRFLRIHSDFDEFQRQIDEHEAHERQYLDDPKPEEDPEGVVLEGLYAEVRHLLPEFPGLYVGCDRYGGYQGKGIPGSMNMMLRVSTDVDLKQLRKEDFLGRLKPAILAYCQYSQRSFSGFIFYSEYAWQRLKNSMETGLPEDGIKYGTGGSLEIPSWWDETSQSARSTPNPNILEDARPKLASGPHAEHGVTDAGQLIVPPGHILLCCPSCSQRFNVKPGFNLLSEYRADCPGCGKPFSFGFAFLSRILLWTVVVPELFALLSSLVTDNAPQSSFLSSPW